MSHDSYLRALQEALRLLRARDRTEAELRERLSAKGFDEGLCDRAVEALLKLHYVNDARVAERAVERAAKNRDGRLLVEHRLTLRGVGQDEIDRALGSLPSEVDQAEEAFWSQRKPGDTPSRAAARLARKGFDEDTVRTVIERHFPELE